MKSSTEGPACVPFAMFARQRQVLTGFVRTSMIDRDTLQCPQLKRRPAAHVISGTEAIGHLSVGCVVSWKSAWLRY